MRISRGLVLVIAIVGYVIAVIDPPTVFSIVVFVTTVLGSAFLPSYVCAVWWRKANAPGALASMVIGASVSFLWQLLGLAESTQLHPMLVGVTSSTIAMIVVSLATQKGWPVPPPIVQAMTESERLGPIPDSLVVHRDESLGSIAAEVARSRNAGANNE